MKGLQSGRGIGTGQISAMNKRLLFAFLVLSVLHSRIRLALSSPMRTLTTILP